MLFTDHFFLLIFFPLFLLLYLPFAKRFAAANLIIVIGSLIFYASFGITNLPLLLIPALIDYQIGRQIFKSQSSRQRKILLFCSVTANLLFLGFYKYFALIIDSLQFMLSTPTYQSLKSNTVSVAEIPLGISFITFQRISYEIDLYRRKISPAANFLHYLVYATIFPHLISGPIVRYKDVAVEITQRTINRDLIFDGMKYFILGLSIKVLIADQLFVYENQLVKNLAHLSSLESLLTLLTFSFRIYLDFWAYSLLALGLARLMGFHFPHNFNAPYQAINFSDFWRRWNITLSGWLRDYLYIPLGGNRLGELRTCINLFVTMLLGGLWHGANWNFVLWGALHGLYLVIERSLAFKKISLPLPNTIKRILVFFVVSLTWSTFLLHTPSELLTLIQQLFSHTYTLNTLAYALQFLLLLAVASICSFWLTDRHFTKIKPTLFWTTLLTLLFICSLGLVLQTQSTPFIYFQF